MAPLGRRWARDRPGRTAPRRRISRPRQPQRSAGALVAPQMKEPRRKSRGSLSSDLLAHTMPETLPYAALFLDHGIATASAGFMTDLGGLHALLGGNTSAEHVADNDANAWISRPLLNDCATLRARLLHNVVVSKRRGGRKSR